jgi:hypothetical protein
VRVVILWCCSMTKCNVITLSEQLLFCDFQELIFTVSRYASSSLLICESFEECLLIAIGCNIACLLLAASCFVSSYLFILSASCCRSSHSIIIAFFFSRLLFFVVDIFCSFCSADCVVINETSSFVPKNLLGYRIFANPPFYRRSFSLFFVPTKSRRSQKNGLIIGIDNTKHQTFESFRLHTRLTRLLSL